MERICVVMCTYQGEAFLQEQLDSISGQSRLPDSMVIVDDHSDDHTVAIARAFAARASFPVRVEVNAENLGFIRNFERAVALADGDILVLSDQDDVWLAPRLEACEQALTRDPEAAAVFSDAHLVDRSLRPMGALLSEAVGFTPRQQHRARSRGMFEILVKGNVVTGATLAFRSTFRDLLLPFTDEIEHDAWIGLLLSAVARIVFVPQPLLLYRQHGGNQIGARPLSLVARLRRARSDRVAGLKRQRARNAQAIVRIEAASAAPERIEILRQAVSHLDLRTGLPERRIARVIPVLQDVVGGRYRRFSHGLASACRDLLA